MRRARRHLSGISGTWSVECLLTQTHAAVFPYSSHSLVWHALQSSMGLRRALFLPLSCLCFHLLAPLLCFANPLDTLQPLPFLVHGPALHDSLHDLACVDVGEGMLSDLPVDAHLFRRRVWVIRQWDKRCPRALVSSAVGDQEHITHGPW